MLEAASRFFKKMRGDDSKEERLVIAPVINEKPLKKPDEDMTPKKGAFGKGINTNPRGSFKGLGHMKTAARWMAQQTWLMELNGKALAKLHAKMEKNKTLPEGGITRAACIWPA